jgi:hypothetical protein
MNCIKYIAIVLSVASLMPACKSEYQQMVDEGLASGERHDSLFLGIHFGMSSKDFFAHCWELNKQQLIKQGNSNTSVEYEMREFPQTVIMNFYPTFHQDSIHEMPAIFHYRAWAPWNKELWSDQLIEELRKLMEQWYGTGFVKLEHPEKGFRYVKVDGNRRIILWKEDDQHVKVLYTDLLKEAAMNAEKEAKREEVSSVEKRAEDSPRR